MHNIPLSINFNCETIDFSPFSTKWSLLIIFFTYYRTFSFAFETFFLTTFSKHLCAVYDMMKEFKYTSIVLIILSCNPHAVLVGDFANMMYEYNNFHLWFTGYLFQTVLMLLHIKKRHENMRKIFKINFERKS